MNENRKCKGYKNEICKICKKQSTKSKTRIIKYYQLRTKNGVIDCQYFKPDRFKCLEN